MTCKIYNKTHLPLPSCSVKSEIDQYLPEGTTSPQFVIRRKGDNQDSEHDIQLPLFGSTSKDDSKLFHNMLIYHCIEAKPMPCVKFILNIV